MARSYKFISLAQEEAEKSRLNYRVGAVITKGSKVMFSGCNNERTKSLNSFAFCQHAELEAARKLNNILLRKRDKNKNKRDLKKYIIWVTRIRSNNQLSESAPCSDCIKKLTNMGFSKVGYTDNDGNIYVKKLEELPHFLSDAQMNFKENIAKHL
jgi:tRNA(Arg) A34 adenosine deaminase TadA